LLLAVTSHQPTTIAATLRRIIFIGNIPGRKEEQENKRNKRNTCKRAAEGVRMSGVAQPHPELNVASILTRNNVDDFYGALGADPNSTREQIVAEFKARVRVWLPAPHLANTMK
jgi:hypothetical protein